MSRFCAWALRSMLLSAPSFLSAGRHRLGAPHRGQLVLEGRAQPPARLLELAEVVVADVERVQPLDVGRIRGGQAPAELERARQRALGVVELAERPHDPALPLDADRQVQIPADVAGLAGGELLADLAAARERRQRARMIAGAEECRPLARPVDRVVAAPVGVVGIERDRRRAPWPSGSAPRARRASPGRRSLRRSAGASGTSAPRRVGGPSIGSPLPGLTSGSS
jgi:hypothetical protein